MLISSPGGTAAAAAAAAKSLQLCLTLCDPIDGSPPGSPVPVILQARTLEWAAIAFSGPGGTGPFQNLRRKLQRQVCGSNTEAPR